MNQLNPQKTGLTLGLMLGLLHVVWSALVALSWAKPLIDWDLEMHMIQGPYTLLAFSWQVALTSVVVAFVIGNVAGFVFASLWNAVHKK